VGGGGKMQGEVAKTSFGKACEAQHTITVIVGYDTRVTAPVHCSTRLQDCEAGEATHVLNG
jgi:hypothetical protein